MNPSYPDHLVGSVNVLHWACIGRINEHFWRVGVVVVIGRLLPDLAIGELHNGFISERPDFREAGTERRDNRAVLDETRRPARVGCNAGLNEGAALGGSRYQNPVLARRTHT